MAEIAPVGLHHVTAIAADPQENVDFYTDVLGLRLVKRTVNFDDPGTYHLYYGDTSGSPASILTFFPWRGVPAGHMGTGLTTATASSVPPSSLGWWQNRLSSLGVGADAPTDRDGAEVLILRDPHGLVLDLVASPGDQRSGWDGAADIPDEHAVRGLHSVTLTEAVTEPTQRLLTEMLGMSLTEENRDRSRFAMADGEAGALVDVVGSAGHRGLQAGGTAMARAEPGADRARTADPLGGTGREGDVVTDVLDRPHVWLPGSSGHPPLLLHGTGVDEHDLLPLRDRLDPMATAAHTSTLLDQFRSAGAETTTAPHDGGHTISPALLPRMADWLADTPGGAQPA